MNPQRLGIAALGLALATWVQLALVPVAHQHPLDPASVLAALVPLAALGAAVVWRERRARWSFAAAAGLYPAALGLAAFVAGRHAVPRFDAPSRVIAALSLTAYAAALIAWWNARETALTATITPLEDRSPPVSPSPPMRRAAFAALAAMTLFVSVLAPAALAAREPATLEDRLGGEELLRGRNALVAAAGLLIAVAMMLGGGSSLMRAPAPKPRSVSRAVVYLLWALAAFVMRYWLDHAG